MEDKTSFDLNRALQRWRDELAQSPQFCKQDIDELECHLSDSLTELETRGLSPEEAFIIATRRIGPTPTLATEFGRIHSAAIWTDRLLWVVLGATFLGLIRSSYVGPLILLIPLGLPPFWSAIFPLIVAGLIVRSMIRGNGYVPRLMSKLLCKPAVLALGVMVVGFAPSGVAFSGINKYMFFGTGGVSFQNVAGASLWPVITALTIFALARRRLRLARS